MGIQNAVARRLAVPDLTTTVLTMTLTGIAADVRTQDRGRAGLGRRVLAVATMFAGAAVGALLVPGPWRSGGTAGQVGQRSIQAAGRPPGRRASRARAAGRQGPDPFGLHG